jgi:multiple sugar transport system permease protein
MAGQTQGLARVAEQASTRQGARAWLGWSTLGAWGTHLILATLALLWVMPIVWMLSTSLKTDTQVFTWPPQWIPRPVHWANYPAALAFMPFFMYMRNTLTIAFGILVGSLISDPLVAYGLSRVRWPLRDTIFIIVLSTMMIPFHVRMIPLFVMFNNLGWRNTFLPLIIPSFTGNAFFIFILRQFFMAIPDELTDAAIIDGASHLVIYLRVILPLAKPAVAVIALFSVLGSWNMFVPPLIYLDHQRLYPISLGLQRYRFEHSTEWSYLMAASTLVVMPVIVLFLFTQHTFIEGITLTGLKG